MKIKAYTLMEVVVAMLLSAICISICYTALEIVSGSYSSYRKKNEEIDNLLSLKNVLEKDFMKAVHILKNENGLMIEQDSVKRLYEFGANKVIRHSDSLYTDTFKVANIDVKFFFEGNEVLENDTIDQVNIDINLATRQKINLMVNKHYSAANLFR